MVGTCQATMHGGGGAEVEVVHKLNFLILYRGTSHHLYDGD